VLKFIVMNERTRLQRARTPEHNPIHRPAASTPDRGASGGEPLDALTRARFEARFGYDFGRVRVHADTSLDSTTPNAVALTTGHDIAFRPGAYAPESREGQWLLAHELTHVVQQETQEQPARSSINRSEDVGGGERGEAEKVSSRGDSSEQAADHAASHVMAGGLGAAALAGSAYGATAQPYIANPDIWENMPSFGDLDIGGGISDVGGAIGGGISSLGGMLGSGIMAGGGFLGGEVAGLGGSIGSTIANIGGNLGQGAEGIGGLFGEGSAGQQIGSLVGGALSGVGSILGGSVAGEAAGLSADIFSGAANIGGTVMGGAGALGAGVSEAASGIGSLVGGLGEIDPSWFLM
jgi:hypothetical protein